MSVRGVFRAVNRTFTKSAPLLRKKEAVVQEIPSKNFRNLKKVQARFQQQDGKPVWLKGKFDKILFNIVIIGLAVGLVNGVTVLVLLALPK